MKFPAKKLWRSHVKFSFEKLSFVKRIIPTLNNELSQFLSSKHCHLIPVTLMVIPPDINVIIEKPLTDGRKGWEWVVCCSRCGTYGCEKQLPSRCCRTSSEQRDLHAPNQKPQRVRARGRERAAFPSSKLSSTVHHRPDGNFPRVRTSYRRHPLTNNTLGE